MKIISELYVLLDDKPGAIRDLARLLKKKQIFVHAIGLFIDTARLHVSDPEKALAAIQDQGYQVELREVLHFDVPNKSGVLLDLTTKLGNAGININHMYGALGEKQERGVVIMEVDNMKLALDIFQTHKFE